MKQCSMYLAKTNFMYVEHNSIEQAYRMQPGISLNLIIITYNIVFLLLFFSCHI